MKHEIFIVLIRVFYHNARKVCEELENSVFTSPPDYEGSGQWYVKDMIQREFSDINEDYISVERISDFMDDLNNDLSLSGVFVSYVLYKKEN